MLLTSFIKPLLVPLLTLPIVNGEDVTAEQTRNRNRTLSVGFVRHQSRFMNQSDLYRSSFQVSSHSISMDL